MCDQCRDVLRLLPCAAFFSPCALKEQVSEQSLRKALTELIDNPSYAEKARAMGEQMHREGGCDRAAQAVIDYVRGLH